MSSTVKAGRISINLTAGTGQFESDLNRATGKLRDFGAHGVSSVQATSAALRVLEGNMQNNLRAAERFLANTLGLGKALQAAFPVVGAVALLGVVGELGKKVYELYEGFQKLQEAPKRIAQEFQGITQPIRVANDELALANVKLENQIAKLQGKPQNHLAEALATARLEADKLAESIDRDLGEVQKLLEKESIGAFKGFFTNTASTSGLADEFKKFQESITQIDLKRNDALQAAAGDDKKQADIYNAASLAKQKAIDAETAKLKQQLVTVKALQAQRDARTTQNISATPYGVTARPLPRDQKAEIAELERTIDTLQQLSLGVTLRETNARDTAHAHALEGDREKDKTSPLQSALADLRAEHSALEREFTQSPGKADPFLQSIAKAAGEADKKISDLVTHGSKLTLADRADLVALETANELLRLQTSLRDKAAESERLRKEAPDIGPQLEEEARKKNEKLQEIAARTQAYRDEAGLANLGPEAAFQAQKAAQLVSIKDPDERAATSNELDQKHAAEIQKKVQELDRETDATNNLTKALNQGINARRQATLADIAASGASKEVIAAEQRKALAQFAQQDAQSGRGQTADQGFRQFFQEMQDNAKSAGQAVHDTLGTAFQGLNQQLIALVEGQKASWSSFFRGLASQIASVGLNNLEANLFSGLLGGGGSNNKSGGGGGFAGFIGSLFGGFRAGGGDVDPGKSYIVGEKGPELFTPPGGGSITPNNKLGGSTAYYTIDARGANSADVEARVQRALIQVHGSAVRQAIASQQEARLRRPRSKS